MLRRDGEATGAYGSLGKPEEDWGWWAYLASTEAGFITAQPDDRRWFVDE